MSDIVERLRNLQAKGLLGYDHEGPMPSYREAADAITALQAENARLREALKSIERATSYPVCTSINPCGYDTRPATKDLVELVAELTRAAVKKEA